MLPPCAVGLGPLKHLFRPIPPPGKFDPKQCSHVSGDHCDRALSTYPQVISSGEQDRIANGRAVLYPQRMRTIIGIVAVLFALANSVFVIAAIYDLTDGQSRTSTGILLAMLLLFGGLTALGAWLAMRMLGHGKAAAIRASEQLVLETARARGGRLTVAELAATTSLTVEQAHAALERLCRQRIAEIHYTDDLTPVYAFRGLLSADEKASARDPLA